MPTDQELQKTFSVSQEGERLIKLVILRGVSDVTSNIRQAELVSQAMLAKLTADKKIDCLVDLSALGPSAHYPSPQARQIYSEIVNQPALDKIAVVAPQGILRAIMRFVAAKMNGKKSIEFFKNQTEALAWLRGEAVNTIARPE